MIGVILSGGQSSRMGRDKGLIAAKGKPWAKIAFEKLAAIGIPALVSVNQHQVQEYLQCFDKDELIVDCTDLKIRGPLRGVLSAHLSHPEEDIIVLACDMINVEPFILEKLHEEYHQNKPEAIAFKGKTIEPLCTIYSARGLQKLKIQCDADSLKSHSMKNALKILETVYLPIRQDWLPLFNSINRVEDLP